MTTFTNFPGCCGAGIISGFYANNEKDFKADIARQINAFASIGNIFAILNGTQFPSYGKWLTECGFQMVGANINNPNHNSKLYFYIYSKPTNLTHHKDAKFIPMDPALEMPPEMRALIERTRPHDVKIDPWTEKYLKETAEAQRMLFFKEHEKELTPEEVKEYKTWKEDIDKRKKEAAEEAKRKIEEANRLARERMERERAEQEARRQAERARIADENERKEKARKEREALKVSAPDVFRLTPIGKAQATRSFNTAAARAAIRNRQQNFTDAKGDVRNAQAYLNPYGYSTIYTRWRY